MRISLTPPNTTGTNPPSQLMNPVQKNRYQQPTAPLPNSPIMNSPYGQPIYPMTYPPNINGQPMQTGPNGQPLYPTQQQQQPVYPPQQYQQQYPQQLQQQPPLQMYQPVPQSADMIYAMEKQRKAEQNTKMGGILQDSGADSCSFGARLCACFTACFCGMLCASIYAS
ncbi:hypothetical protein AOQ84DRAFT_353531 [Glonium stellatum]|uniref:Uncharacterized protein n=1 Tax=Glonium stellatum TaxID=574774 RepID=A0A8E2F4L0_9PEZI|nr:hypothetical protein AOQ84DRAFT_353531 [Glonium stellatum]